MTDINQNVLETFIKRFSSSDQAVEEFKQRVFSFIEGQKWVSRPLILSPLICAKYGWKCVNPNLLECVSCGAKLCTQEPKIENYDAYKSCLNKIVADLKEGHKTQCPWPLAPSPESFVKMVSLPKEESLSQLVNRLKPCLDFENSIPQIKDSVLSELGLKQEDVNSIFKVSKLTPVHTHEVGMSIVCLAATGWTLSSKKSCEMMTYVKCDSCQRSIWVKSFNLINTKSSDDCSITKDGKESISDVENGTSAEKVSLSNVENGTSAEKVSLSNVENGTSAEKESSSTSEKEINSIKEASCKRNLENSSTEKLPKRLKLDKRDFDPLEEHRSWCLWVSRTDIGNNIPFGKKEEAEAPVPGWKIYMKSLLRNISSSGDNSESTPSKEYVRSLHNLLDNWTSPILA